MNILWDKYGCTVCDKYPVLILTVNHIEDKSSFKSDFIDKYGVESPCVSKDDGGTLFDSALGNLVYSGSKYLIYPDKSIKGDMNQMVFASEADIINAGITEHSCNNSIYTISHGKNLTNLPSIITSNKSGFIVNVVKEGVYSMHFYSFNGQIKTTITSRSLQIGNHSISWEKGALSKGIYLSKIISGTEVTRQKVIIK